MWGSRFLVAQLGDAEIRSRSRCRSTGGCSASSPRSRSSTAVGFGLAPAWRARRLDAADAVATPATAASTRRGAVSGPLVVGQMALSLVLVVAAALFGRTFSALATRDIGFDPDDLHVAFIERRHACAGARARRVYGELQQAAPAVPGVQHGRGLDDRAAQRHGLEQRRQSPGRAAHAPAATR